MDHDDSATRAVGDGLWDWNLESNRVHFSPRWVALVGGDDHEVGNAPEEWFDRVHPDDRATLERDLDQRLAHGPDQFDLRHRLLHKDGAHRWTSCRCVVTRGEDGRPTRVLGAHADVTAETVLDPVTGLPNSLLLTDRLRRSIDEAARASHFHFALLRIDLDQVTAGDEVRRPAVSDALLAAVARRLETGLRVVDNGPALRRDDLVARIQGDQFAVLLDGLKDVGAARAVADKLLAALLLPFALGDREALLRPSIGIAVSATRYTRPDDALRDAEAASHRARLLGKARYEVFDTAVLKVRDGERSVEAELAVALDRREFTLFYQPIVSLTLNRMVGVEALARWRHPVRGMVQPADFIPIAEQTGFIVSLGQWVLREACSQLKAWQDSLPLAHDLWVSINLSVVQLRHAEIVDHVREALNDSGVPPHCVVLELTESVAMENPTAIRIVLMQLRALGVRIALDDFGSGHSSLSHLRQLPTDFLKVDRSFLRGMGAQRDAAEIFGTVTAMGQQLGLGVVAEGLERDEQVTMVRSHPCEFAQGYIFSRPLDRDAATALIKAGLPANAGGDGSAVGARLRQALDVVWTALQRWRRPAPIPARHAAGALAVVLLVGLPSGARHLPWRETGVLETRQPVAWAHVPLAPAATAIRPQDANGAAEPPLADGARESRTGAPTRAVGRMRGVHDPTPRAAAPDTPSTLSHTAVMPLDAVTAEAPAPVPAAEPALDRSAAVFGVVHQHVVGGCRGTLTVSRDGVSFVPEDPRGKDGFVLQYGAFIHALADQSLTIKSTTRTYRFRDEEAAGKGGRASRLPDVVASLRSFQ